MKKIIPILLIIPNIVFATDAIELIDSSSAVVKNVLIPLAFSLALLYFFWGVAKYIKIGAGNEKAAEEGKKIMIWGIVGLFIAFSVWGIITFIQSELGIPNTPNPKIPLINASYSTVKFEEQ